MMKNSGLLNGAESAEMIVISFLWDYNTHYYFSLGEVYVGRIGMILDYIVWISENVIKLKCYGDEIGIFWQWFLKWLFVKICLAS